MIDETHADDKNTPSYDQEGHCPLDAKSDERHVTGEFKDGITREEEEQADGVTGTDTEFEFLFHSGDLSLTNIDTINDL